MFKLIRTYVGNDDSLFDEEGTFFRDKFISDKFRQFKEEYPGFISDTNGIAQTPSKAVREYLFETAESALSFSRVRHTAVPNDYFVDLPGLLDYLYTNSISYSDEIIEVK